jgi:hypothetical protein
VFIFGGDRVSDLFCFLCAVFCLVISVLCLVSNIALVSVLTIGSLP